MTAAEKREISQFGEARREVVGIFDTPESLEATMAELSNSGFDRADMSLLGQKSLLVPEPTTEGSSEDIADDPTVQRDAIVTEPDIRQSRTLAAGMAGVAAAFLASGATIMTGGTALAAIIGAAAAGGGATIAVDAIGKLLAEKRSAFLEEQIRHGGIVLWVTLPAPERETQVKKIMTRNGAIAVHVHDAAAEGRVEPADKRQKLL